MTPRQLAPSDIAPPGSPEWGRTVTASTTLQKGQPMTDTPTSVTITATDPTTHRGTTRTFHDTHLSIDGTLAPRTARDQANDYITARRAAGCEIEVVTSAAVSRVAPMLEGEGL